MHTIKFNDDQDNEKSMTFSGSEELKSILAYQAKGKTVRVKTDSLYWILNMTSEHNALVNGHTVVGKKNDETYAEQNVKLFHDETTIGRQYASYDPNDNDWMTVIHDGQELSLNLKNWKALVSLANRVIPAE